MKSLVDQGEKIALMDFDGFNYYCEEAMKIRYRAYVLKCKKEKRPILQGDLEVVDGKVIDHVGMLE